MKKRIITAVLVIMITAFMIAPSFAIQNNAQIMPTIYTAMYGDTNEWYDSVIFVVIFSVIVCAVFAVATHFYVKNHSDDDDYDDDDLDFGSSSSYRSSRRSSSRSSGRGGRGRSGGGGAGRR